MYKKTWVSKIIIALLVFLLMPGTLINCASKAVGSIETSNMNERVADNLPSPDKTPIQNSNNSENIPVDSSKIPTLTYCELVKDAGAYDKKIVRVRAIYLNEFERSYFYDSRCEKGEAPDAPKNVPGETWAEWDKSFATEGDSIQAKLNREIKGFGRRDVTVVGRFYSTGERNDPTAPNRFGHLNCCRFQFRIMRVEKVVHLDKKIEKAADVYGKAVKYAFLQKLVFPDFTLEYIKDPSVMTAEPVYPFIVSRESEKIIIRQEGMDAASPLKFKFAGADYELELGVSDKSGRLASDELIVWKTRQK